VDEVEALVVGEKEVGLKRFNQEDCSFTYRSSLFKRVSSMLVSEVSLMLPELEVTKEIALGKIKEERDTRQAKQPWDWPSAGCAFKNIVYSPEMEKYSGWATNGKIPAAKLIDECGLKGLKVGGAEVAVEHANFIINSGGATAADVANLIALIKEKVKNKFGLELEEEIQYLGF
jgi:UDP-N-acetylmuramate dehydrogenase